MKPKYIFYFHDNKIMYTKKGEIITYTFTLDSLLYGKIINIDIFIKEFKKFIHSEKINTILSPNILVIVPFNYYNTDKEILLMVLNSLGINKVEYKNELEFYPLKKNTTILNIHETYLLETININNKIKNYIYPFNIFKNMKQLLNFISSKNNSNSYFLIGTNKDIPNFAEYFKKDSIEIHYYNNYQTYIIDKAIKRSKK